MKINNNHANKYGIMRTKTFLFATISLLFMMFGVGCEEDNQSYQGKIISLNVGACYNIIQIEKSISKGLPINSTITFDSSLYKGQLKVGDTVYFKITKYEEWTGIVLAMCVGPQYDAQLEFYQ
jgi:molybdopterin-binding protein